MKSLSDRSPHKEVQGLALGPVLSSDRCSVTCFGCVSLIKTLGSRVLVYKMGFSLERAGACVTVGSQHLKTGRLVQASREHRTSHFVWVFTSTSLFPFFQRSLSFGAYIVLFSFWWEGKCIPDNKILTRGETL